MRATNRSRGSIVIGLAVGLFSVSAALVGAHFTLGQGDSQDAPVPKTAAPQAPRSLPAKVWLTLGQERWRMSWSELGVSSQGDKVSLDRDTATAALEAMRVKVDKAPSNAWLDYDGRKVHSEADGRRLDVMAALGTLRAAAVAKAEEVAIPTVAIAPDIRVSDLGIEDISAVISRFTTRFAVHEKSRNYNLKLAASRLHGVVLKPGELLSFNETVGSRDLEFGYKIAHVIVAGEMVDGDAGGTCQISTSLHGAAFFAGLEIVYSRPHSRPSTYVTMGLDATVVWPNTDLKLRNPYDFPVIINYKVARGESTVEILGREKPYDAIHFEREIVETLPFETVIREVPEWPLEAKVTTQWGFKGYRVNRYRKYYRDNKLVKTDKWKLRYLPVTEIVKAGANPDPMAEMPTLKQKRNHGPKAPYRSTRRCKSAKACERVN